jgi:hypothetical protein
VPGIADRRWQHSNTHIGNERPELVPEIQSIRPKMAQLIYNNKEKIAILKGPIAEFKKYHYGFLEDVCLPFARNEASRK